LNINTYGLIYSAILPSCSLQTKSHAACFYPQTSGFRVIRIIPIWDFLFQMCSILRTHNLERNTASIIGEPIEAGPTARPMKPSIDQEIRKVSMADDDNLTIRTSKDEGPYKLCPFGQQFRIIGKRGALFHIPFLGCEKVIRELDPIFVFRLYRGKRGACIAGMFARLLQMRKGDDTRKSVESLPCLIVQHWIKGCKDGFQASFGGDDKMRVGLLKNLYVSTILAACLLPLPVR
jgi:hypothetical protein